MGTVPNSGDCPHNKLAARPGGQSRIFLGPVPMIFLAGNLRGLSPLTNGTTIGDSPLFQMRHGYCAGGLYGGCGVRACHAAGHGASTWTIWRFPCVEVRLERAFRHAWTMQPRRSMLRMPRHLRVFEWRAGQSPSVSRRMRATAVRRRALAAPPMPAPSTAWPNARRATEIPEAAPSACGARTRPSL